MEPVNKQQIVRDFKQTFTTEYGVRVLQNLMMVCGGHITQDLFDKDNERNTAYNLGKNRVYRHILTMLNSDPDSTPDDSIIENEKQGE